MGSDKYPMKALQIALQLMQQRYQTSYERVVVTSELPLISPRSEDGEATFTTRSIRVV
jgi:hypothetical protein